MVNASERFRWIVLGMVVALLGNILTLGLWTWAVLSTPPGFDVRFLGDSFLSLALVLATLILGLPIGVVGLLQRGQRMIGAIIIFFSITPFPASFVLLHALAKWHRITLAP